MKVEPRNEMRQQAMALFEMHTALLDAGFTPEQAMDLIKHMLTMGTGSNE